MSKKELVETKAAGLPVIPMADMMADAGMGFEGMTANDIAIPFTSILQGLSPQVKKGNPAKIDGAEEGDIFNTVSKEIVKGDVGITVVPCAYQKKWVEWKTRESGGGFIRQHDTDEILKKTTKNERGQDCLDKDTIIVTTAYHYVLVVTPEGFFRSVISMTSTNLKKSRKWNSQMGAIQLTGQGGRKFPAPMFSHTYLMRSVMETKDANSWFTWDASQPTLINDADLYAAAKKFSQEVNGGSVKVQEPVDETAATENHADNKEF